MSESQEQTTTESNAARRFLVTWQIDEFASSPRAAAMQALKQQRDPASIATVFKVQEFDAGGELLPAVTEIDLLDTDGLDDI